MLNTKSLAASFEAKLVFLVRMIPFKVTDFIRHITAVVHLTRLVSDIPKVSIWISILDFKLLPNMPMRIELPQEWLIFEQCPAHLFVLPL